MKVKYDRRLFWFLKEGAEIDLSKRAHLKAENFLVLR